MTNNLIQKEKEEIVRLGEKIESIIEKISEIEDNLEETEQFKENEELEDLKQALHILMKEKQECVKWKIRSKLTHRFGLN